MEVINRNQAAAQPAAVKSVPAAQTQTGARTVELFPEAPVVDRQTDADRRHNSSGEKPAAISKDQAMQMTDEMNQFMAKLNTDIQFSLHEKTHRLMLKVVNGKTGDVLKEIPSQDMLDMIARISDYVGLLLDKKA